MQEQPHHQGAGHKQQRESKQGIYLTDNLVDWQHGGDDIVAEDDTYPHHRITADGMQNLRRRINKHRSHHDQQQHGKHQHNVLRGLTQILTNQLRQSGTVMAHGEHTREVIMHSSGKDTAENDPQISHRTKLRTHDGTEDRTCTRNVQKLDHKNLPRRQHDVVETIGLGHCRRHTIIGAKHPFDETAVEQITNHESHKAQQK